MFGCLRLRFFHISNNLFIICCLILGACFLVQIKILYNSHQKQLRIKDYNSWMNDLKDTMTTVEKVANYTNEVMKKIENAISQHKIKYTKHKSS